MGEGEQSAHGGLEPTGRVTIWRRQVHWDAGDLAWRVGALFIAGSALFAIGSFPLYYGVASAGVVAATFAVGSVFFTAAAGSQLVEVLRDHPGPSPLPGVRLRRLEWWAVAIQLAGTVLFNLSTFRAVDDGLDAAETDRLVWAPDMLGSIAFLLASACAWVSLVGWHWREKPNDAEWWVNLLNGVGSVFFMIAAVAALVLPTTAEMINTALVNLGTFAGAVCFLLGAYLIWPAIESE